MKTKPSAQSLAFTRLELAALLVCLGLTALVALPLAARPSTRADRVACVNNLRQIGQALALWGSEHNDFYSWEAPYNPSDPTSFGTMGSLYHEQFWFQCYCLSNELPSPAVLACPGDQRLGKKTARTWDMNPEGGFLNGAYKNNAISYLLNVHPDASQPAFVFALDRNVGSLSRGGCSWGFQTVAQATISGGTTGLSWTNDVHGAGAGNLLYLDGQVQQTGDAGLRAAFITSITSILGGSSGVGHLLFPF
jgi:type II secretory pathway pseudopilin PulG